MVNLDKARAAARIAVGSLKDVPALEPIEVTITITGIEILALKKLSLVSFALAGSLKNVSAAQEQTVLAATLDELIRQIEIKRASHG